MFDFVNGKTTEKSVIAFAVLWGLLNSFSKYVQGAQSTSEILVTFFGSVIVGGLLSLLVGKIISLFTKNKRHTISIANWILLVGSALTLVTATVALAA